LVDELRSRLRGPVTTPEDAEYDSVRRVWNAAADRRPAAIVHATGTGDVRDALRVARELGLPVSVRGSGHHVAGHAVRDGAVVIDLGRLTAVEIDPAARRARAQAGATWGQLDGLASTAGLATTGGRISSVGIAGLTLGGGYGWLMRRFGLTIDNLVAVELVTADGRVVTASAGEHPDLFWALRGGGGNFGIATAFVYRLHPLGPEVTGGAAFYPADSAGEVLRGFRALMATAPDTLGAQFTFVRLPAAPFVPPPLHGRLAAAIVVCHCGSADQARAGLRALEHVAPPLLWRIGRMPYTRIQRLFDAAGAHGNRVRGASGQLADLGDAACDALLAHAGALPSPQSIVMVTAMGGAVARVGGADSAFSHRRSAFAYAADAVWDDPAADERHAAWTDAVEASMQPFSTGVYVNELGAGGDLRRAYAPPLLARLREVKRAWDPGNVFDGNHNIAP
jgi:FAD/FMN-containing dehydrogenase